MSEVITAECEGCGLKVSDSATEDRPCPNCHRTLRYVGGPAVEAPAPEPTPEEAWEALSEDDQLAVLEYLEATATFGAGTF